jgi:hypothetical protein
MGLIFLATILFAFLDRLTFIYSRTPFLNDSRLYYTMENIFVSIDFSFPFIIAVGFVVLYFKYYRNMVNDMLI